MDDHPLWPGDTASAGPAKAAVALMGSVLALALATGTLFAPASAQTGPSTREIWPIVPGAAIGPVRLGMSRAEVARAHAGLPCEVTATYVGERAAFRVIHAVEGGLLIQAIAVFGKTGTSAPPAPPGFPVPGGGGAD